MGAFLAQSAGAFRWDIFLLCMATTVFLQILSNLANDYGDSIHGADHADRKGPARAVQSGAISPMQMRRAIVVLILLSLVSGIVLLTIAFGSQWRAMVFFFGLGLLSIAAAVAYTVGRKPYGYLGLGDFAVLVFFGLVGVMGSFYLFTQTVPRYELLPSLSMGLLSVAVLNVNNIRDIDSDRMAGKYSLPVRMGRSRAIVYHWVLLGLAVACALLYTLITFRSEWQFLFMLAIPLFIRNGLAVSRKPPELLDPYLRQLAVSTLLFVLLFGVGLTL